MNLRDLQYLTAVADHEHFGKAARACNTSQPTLSMQLKKLEETLGVQLFERTNKQVMITPVGEEIAQRARRILREAEEIKAVAKTAQDPYAGEFRLGVFPTLAPYFLPQAVPAIRRKLPKLKLLLIEEKTESLVERLKAGTLDAALLALPVHEDALSGKAISRTSDCYYWKTGIACARRHWKYAAWPGPMSRNSALPASRRFVIWWPPASVSR
jgi:LysR family hydrogen peroxide-inducible transcriptional activator